MKLHVMHFEKYSFLSTCIWCSCYLALNLTDQNMQQAHWSVTGSCRRTCYTKCCAAFPFHFSLSVLLCLQCVGTSSLVKKTLLMALFYIAELPIDAEQHFSLLPSRSCLCLLPCLFLFASVRTHTKQQHVCLLHQAQSSHADLAIKGPTPNIQHLPPSHNTLVIGCVESVLLQSALWSRA